MSVSDPIADFLTCVRNALKARKQTVTVPSSKLKTRIAEILKEEGFIKNVKVVEEGSKKYLVLYLKYLKDQRPAIKKMSRLSRPGLRRYSDSTKIPRVLNGLGIVILSTSSGVMTGKEARKAHIGGEVLCTIS